MIRTAFRFILIVLALIAAAALGGYYSLSRDFNPSRVIGVFSLFGYGVLMFFLWYASLAPFAQKRKAGILTYILIVFTLFFSYSVLALDSFVILSVAFAGISGIFAALNHKKTALLFALASAVHFVFLTASSFWNGRSANFVLYAAILAAVFVYLGYFFPRAKKGS